MRYKCIIFDCDGVLVDTEDISNRVIIAMANDLGAKINYNYGIEHFYGKSMRYIYDHIESLIGSKLPNEFNNEFRRRTFELFKTDLKPISGIHELLEKISIPYCVASNGPLEKMRLSLTATNLIDKFKDNMFSAYEIERWKPDPGVFLYAADNMGFEPKDCLVVEDSIVGVQAAMNGGFDVLAFANQNNQAAFINEGVEVFFSMEELLSKLEVRS